MVEEAGSAAERWRRDTDALGMYLFLASELMLFGALAAAALFLRMAHPDEIVAASTKLHLWIGAANTLILLTSSMAVALAVELARRERAKQVATCVAAAVLLGGLFLVLKGFEYHAEYTEGLLPGFGANRFAGPAEHLFMNLYLIATALHALHLAVGMLLLGTIAWRLRGRGMKLPGSLSFVENSGLYWHLVDVIWVFLYPLLYLVR